MKHKNLFECYDENGKIVEVKNIVLFEHHDFKPVYR